MTVWERLDRVPIGVWWALGGLAGLVYGVLT